MNVRAIFGRVRKPSNAHDEIAYNVSSDEKSAVSANGKRSRRNECNRSANKTETHGCLLSEDLDEDILSQGSSESSSSTASSSTGSLPDRQTVVYGARRQRADTVCTVFQDPALWRCLANFQVEYLGGMLDSEDCFPSMSIHRGEPWLFENDMDKDQVAVAVEATAICELDLTLGRRQAEHDGRDHPTASHRVLGSNFVGIVHHSSPSAEKSGFEPGTRVASIVDGGSNARYVSIGAEKLIKVAKHLDAADVACLISAYLPAFQALHHGGPTSRRYTKNSLLGKKVLIIQGASPEAQALVRLARLAGASEIYVTASKDHFWQLEKSGCTLLEEHPDDWLQEVYEGMDLVVNYEFPRYFSETKSALAPKGRLVCCAPMHTSGDESWITYFESMLGYLQLLTMKRATVFDFAENHELDQDQVRDDLSHLLKLLAARKVRPEIDRYIKLSDVPKTYKRMRKERRQGCMAFPGTIICEPWRE